MTKFRGQSINILIFSNTAFFFILVLTASFQSRAQNLILDTQFMGRVSDAAAKNWVTALQPDGKILVGGNFRFTNGSQIRGIARLNEDGTLDTNFNVGGSGASSSVYDIVTMNDGKILICGTFTSYNGMSVNGLARLNADGTLDTTFNAGGSGVFGQGSTFNVDALAVQGDGKIIAAGQSVAATVFFGHSGHADCSSGWLVVALWRPTSTREDAHMMRSRRNCEQASKEASLKSSFRPFANAKGVV